MLEYLKASSFKTQAQRGDFKGSLKENHKVLQSVLFPQLQPWSWSSFGFSWRLIKGLLGYSQSQPFHTGLPGNFSKDSSDVTLRIQNASGSL